MKTKFARIKKILLIEDNQSDVKTTLAVLDKYHLARKVVVVNDGAEALDYLYRRGRFEKRPRGNPSLVLLDTNMPKVTSLEVLEAIKADEHLKTIPVQLLNERLI
jgi:CheY-like chemotaxis protein